MKAPPFKITETILNCSVRIAEILGSLNTLHLEKPTINLRKQNKIKTIHSSLAIEGNTLSIEQVTDIINKKPIIGPSKDIKEVKNAIKVYDVIDQFNFKSILSFKKAHKLLMNGLIKDAGLFRAGNVGVFAGSAVSHVAPPSKQVPRLMTNLFAYIKKTDNISLLIKACVFHYELEFIHPFSDGNGRMGRLWQQVILMNYHSIFEYLSIESLIKENQQRYYQVLNECDLAGDSTLFVEFGLELIEKSLSMYQNTITYIPNTKEERIKYARDHFKNQWFSRQEYMKLHKTISSATASRDLKFALEDNFLHKKGDKNLARYKFRKK